jgi:hypothetical protein
MQASKTFVDQVSTLVCSTLVALICSDAARLRHKGLKLAGHTINIPSKS